MLLELYSYLINAYFEILTSFQKKKKNSSMFMFLIVVNENGCIDWLQTVHGVASKLNFLQVGVELVTLYHY